MSQALDAVADGRCAALVLCGALSGTADGWVSMAGALPADVLLLHSVLGWEMDLGPNAGSEPEPEAEDESQYLDSDEGGLAIVEGLLGAVDVLWTDVAGLVALFDDELKAPEAVSIHEACQKVWDKYDADKSGTMDLGVSTRSIRQLLVIVGQSSSGMYSQQHYGSVFHRLG